MLQRSVLVTSVAVLVYVMVCFPAIGADWESSPNVEIMPNRCPDLASLSPREQWAMLRHVNCTIDETTDPITNEAPSEEPILQLAATTIPTTLLSTLQFVIRKLRISLRS